MHLKKLELSGFKSFAKRTVLDFPHGITVIAGPNGAGKSNVVDAIRWALAEQGLKNLRGKKSEDLIFFGSAGRHPLARASVALNFEMGESENHLGLSEANVEREVSRSGENGYLLNGRRVRLMDMEEFLAKSSIGDSSFRIVSQGLSDKLLNLSPAEFRNFVEEAAGVKEFQDKRHQAELRLARTRENLERVGSILAELAPRLKVLKREKDKLEKKEAYSNELKAAARRLFGLKHGAILAWENKIAARKKEIKQAIKPLAEEIKRLREGAFSWDKKTGLGAEIAAWAAEVKRLTREENEIARQIISAEGEIKLGEAKEKQLLPVSAEYLKAKIGEVVNKLNVDFKGLDTEQLRQLLAAAALRLQDLLRVMEQGLDLAGHGQTLPLLKQGLEKLLTLERGTRAKLEQAAAELALKENAFAAERSAALAEEKTLRGKESELYGWENSLRQIELEEEKLKLHQAKFHQDLNGLGVITLAEVLDRQTETSPKIILSSHAPPSPMAMEGHGKASEDKAAEAVLEEKVWKLKRRLEEVGAIDEKVVKEFAAVSERHDFLTKESADLTTALKSLEELIFGLEKEVNSRYKITLSEMSHVFGGYFRLMFGGGKATLASAKVANPKSEIRNPKKEEEPNPEKEVKNGVEIKLELPGKKVKSLSTLSGGERTLTSIALLFALANIRKPPVMVLDEIDAALDETNTAKFIRLVKDLSRETQFIIITHNRETMRHADALYGVSMKDGISHLLSLKLQSA